ncbi:D-arabinono-1,4-lactone oxidase [Agromyces agglutinans]|uniref:D-arabinono-1,4-lactone oxidase n=1 Tax=Agromyces agglutinans TaxID=2662258 RepID=UPI0028B092C7|nr:D-arabinono-1,4-lactone oxidase [Agromyces agglutinans]
MTDPEQRNWAGNLAYRASRIVHPSSHDELLEALAGDGPVRVLGTRHAFNDLADTTGTLIATDRMPRTVEVVRSGAELAAAVRVAGGIRYGDLAPRLHEGGLALANLASLPHISVAGAIATGTHGSGDAIGSLASAVRALTIVTVSGEPVTLRRGDPDFAGAVVHLGALGVVTAVELDVEPTYDVAQHVFESPSWDAILADLDAVTGLGTSVSVFTRWVDADRADQLWIKQRMPPAAVEADDVAVGDAAVGDAAAGDDASRRRAEVVARLGGRAATEARHPIIGLTADACTPQLGEPGPWFERLPHFRLEFTPSAGAELQSEYLVPRADAVAAVEAIRSLAGRIAPLLQVCEVRTVRADDLWLSPASERDVVGIHFTWRLDEPGVTALLPVIEAALPATARPHWGKLFALPAEELRARYPRFDDFAALRARLDPDGRLRNDYLARIGL